MQSDIMVSEKKVVEQLAEIERTVDCNQLTFDGLKLWPLIRLMLYPVFRGYVHAIKQPEYIPVLSVSNSAKKQFKKNKNTDIVFLSYLSEHHDVLDRKKNSPAIDSLIEALHNKYVIKKFLLVPPRQLAFLIDKIPLRLIMAFTSVVSGLNTIKNKIAVTGSFLYPVMLLSPKITGYTNTSRLIDEKMNSDNARALNKFGTIVNASTVVIQAAVIMAWESYFLRCLSIVKPKAVFFRCYYQLYTLALISACKKLAIPTVDIQHGLVNSYHGMYTHWTNIPREGYSLLPDYFWCWGNETKKQLERWFVPGQSPHKAVVGGNLSIVKKGTTPLFKYKRKEVRFLNSVSCSSAVILITLQYPRDNKLLPEFVFSCIAESPDSWFWLLRVHPYYRQSVAARLLKVRIKNYKNCDIDNATTLPLHCFLNKVTHHITECSSLAYEALALDIPTTFFHPSAKEYFEEDLKNGIFAYADSANALSSSIRQGFSKPIDHTTYIETNPAIAETALKTVIEGF